MYTARCCVKLYLFGRSRALYIYLRRSCCMEHLQRTSRTHSLGCRRLLPSPRVVPLASGGQTSSAEDSPASTKHRQSRSTDRPAATATSRQHLASFGRASRFQNATAKAVFFLACKIEASHVTIEAVCCLQQLQNPVLVRASSAPQFKQKASITASRICARPTLAIYTV